MPRPKLVRQKLRKRKPGNRGKLLNRELVDAIRREIIEHNPTIAQLCRVFNINKTTYYRWIKENPALKSAVDEAREISDRMLADEARESLAKLVKGGRRRRKVVEKDKKGRVVREKETRETFLPDERACEFVLKNLEPDKWRDKVEHDVGPQFGELVDRLNNALKRKANAAAGSENKS